MLFQALSLAAISALSSSLAFAREPVLKLGSGIPLDLSKPEMEATELTFESSDTYKIGDEWGKKAFRNGDLIDQPQLLRAARATASLGGATGFFLGVFNGEAVLATNHHVCPSLSACVGKQASFPLLGKQARVVRSLGTWTEIDLSLVVVNLNARDISVLESVAGNFDFVSNIKPGQLLFTAGFGIASNPMRRLVMNQDSDCKVFSNEGDFRLMADPDRLNPGTYETWSFANGCDVSHGDSGSAMVDRKSGKPVGLIWTGKIPKSPIVQSSERLDGLVGSDDDAVWTELSYAVPAVKIKEYLTNLIANGELTEQDGATIGAVLGNASIL